MPPDEAAGKQCEKGLVFANVSSCLMALAHKVFVQCWEPWDLALCWAPGAAARWQLLDGLPGALDLVGMSTDPAVSECPRA